MENSSEINELRNRLRISVDCLALVQKHTNLQEKLQKEKEQNEEMRLNHATVSQPSSLPEKEIRSFLGQICGLINGESLEGSPDCFSELEDNDLRLTFEELASRLDETLNRWSKEVKTQEATSNLLRLQVSALASRLVAKDAEIEESNNRMTKLQAQLARETTQANRKIKRLNGKNKQLQREYNERSEILFKVHVEKESLKRKLSQSEEHLSDSDKELQDLLVQRTELEATITKLNKELESCHELRDKFEEESKRQMENQQSLEAKLKEALEQKMELKEAQDRSAKDIALVREQLSEAAYEFLGREQQLHQQVQDHRESIEAERAVTSERIGKLEEKQKKQDRKARLLSKQVSEADQENKLNQQMITELANQVYSLQNVKVELNNCLQLEVARRNEVNEHLEQVTAKLEQEREESAERLHLYQLRVESFELQLAEAQAAGKKRVHAPTQTYVSTIDSPMAEVLDDLLHESARFKVELLILEEKYREVADRTLRCEQRKKDQCPVETTSVSISL